MTVTSADTIPEFPKIIYADQQAANQPAAPKPWAQEMFNFNRDVTGSVGGSGNSSSSADDKKSADEKKSAEDKKDDSSLKVTTKPPDSPKLEVGGASVPIEQGRMASPGERAVLERLQGRRQELETRNRELEMRENLIKAAEQRLEAKLSELKAMEARVNNAVGSRDKVEAQRFKGIVQMYENMKPKEAARIFDRLDMKILVEVSTQMSARKMSEILAQMSPEAAERLTVELAGKVGEQGKPQEPDQLPKIEGKPVN
jgi:flagellar motility protein MotE (MotC chaperone)